MFMKQYNYKPRSMSTSSTGSQEGATAGSPPKDGANPANAANKATTSTVLGQTGGAAATGAAAGRRRVRFDPSCTEDP